MRKHGCENANNGTLAPTTYALPVSSFPDLYKLPGQFGDHDAPEIVLVDLHCSHLALGVPNSEFIIHVIDEHRVGREHLATEPLGFVDFRLIIVTVLFFLFVVFLG